MNLTSQRRGGYLAPLRPVGSPDAASPISRSGSLRYSPLLCDRGSSPFVAPPVARWRTNLLAPAIFIRGLAQSSRAAGRATIAPIPLMSSVEATDRQHSTDDSSEAGRFFAKQ